MSMPGSAFGVGDSLGASVGRAVHLALEQLKSSAWETATTEGRVLWARGLYPFA